MPGEPRSIAELVDGWKADGLPLRFAEEPDGDGARESHLEPRVRIAFSIVPILGVELHLQERLEPVLVPSERGQLFHP